MLISSLSSQGQTTIPASLRSYLSLVPGKSLVWEEAIDELGVKHLKIYPSGTDYLLSLQGIAKSAAQKHGSATTILERERSAWDKKYI